MRKRIVHQYMPVDMHEDSRRRLSIFFNGDFIAKQIKIIEVIEDDAILGNHYHTYDEAFYVVKGCANYDVYDLKTKKYANFVLVRGESLFIKAHTAHRATFNRGTIMVEATSEKHTKEKARKWDKWQKIR